MPLSRRAASDDRLDVPDNGVDLVDVGVEVGAYLRVGYAGGGDVQRRPVRNQALDGVLDRVFGALWGVAAGAHMFVGAACPGRVSPVGWKVAGIGGGQGDDEGSALARPGAVGADPPAVGGGDGDG